MFQIIFLYFIFYINFINLTTNQFLSKDEVLNLRDEFYNSFYCKDNICVQIDYSYSDPYVFFPGKNNSTIKYIAYTCSYDEIDLGDCGNRICSDIYSDRNGTIIEECDSVQCDKDSECLYNKCYKDHCVITNDTSVVHCDSIYPEANTSYMYCGKAFKQSCNNNDECSSKICYNGVCERQTQEPDRPDLRNEAIKMYFNAGLIFMIIVAILFCYCVMCCNNDDNNNKLKHNIYS